MNKTFSAGQVICRPALERDREEIREFCKTIWDGHDYVPDVIDDWLQDPQGIFAVAEYQGHAIACSKITLLAEGQWWLEGFRVDPAYQGLKVGSLIHRYVDRWWVEKGDGILRLMTSSKNKSVHHLCEITGFSQLYEVRGYKAEPLKGRAEEFASAASSAQDLPTVVAFARKSPSLSITNRIVDFGWRAVDPTQNLALTFLFADASDLANNFFWWRKDRGLLIVWDDSDPEEEKYTMGIGVLACELEDMSAFLMDVRHLAAKQGKTSVFWLAPVHEQVEAALKQADFSSDWDNTAFIFEKIHPQRSHQAEPPS
ncbi:MAG TPA: GNAT family N-acetyltransferase [Anaerolineales bacterium]|nr:GNAT family N-acetyltransferase [Anaerolineales bacterium]